MAKILLVEDVDIVRTVLRSFLESAGHDVTECEGGNEAIRIVGATNFDVVVTDLWMKNGDGVEFIRVQSASGRSQPIIATTGGDPSVGESRSAEFARSAGATRVLIKPVTKTDILKAIDFAVGQKGGSPEIGAVNATRTGPSQTEARRRLPGHRGDSLAQG